MACTSGEYNINLGVSMRHPHTLVAAACGIVITVAGANAQRSAYASNAVNYTTTVADTTVPKDTTKTPTDTTKTPKDTTKTPTDTVKTPVAPKLQ
jgi:hypothetical protein